MATTPRIPNDRFIVYQQVISGQADGPLIIIKIGPDGHLVVEKHPDPRGDPAFKIARILRVLGAAADLDKSIADQIGRALQPALEQQIAEAGHR